MRPIFVAAGMALIATSADALPRHPALPPGYAYAPGSYVAKPTDPCRQDGIADGLVRLINAQARLGKTATRLDDIASPDWADNNDPSRPGMSCHGVLTFDDGAAQPGTVLAHDPGGAAPMQVAWKPDCNGQPYYAASIGCPASGKPDRRKPYVPQWTKVSHADDYAVYVDDASRRPGTNNEGHDHTIEMSDLVDFKGPQDWGFGPVLSVKSRVRFDCAGGQLITLDHAYHGDAMGAGQDLQDAPAGESWHEPAPGTADDFVFRHACGGGHRP